MPTLLGRRYYRKLESVSRREKVAGVVILLLTVGTVAGFVGQTATSRGDLFGVDPDRYREAEGGHQVELAGQMLPALDDAAWRADGDAEALAADELNEALGDDASALLDFGVQWVYRRVYAASDAEAGALTVLVCDAATPAQAFGLCRTCRPDQWDPLRVGRDGWISSKYGKAAFWSGRYFTELRAPSTMVDPVSVLAMAAKSVAAGQLDYGGSFWAESMLPSANRVPDTLRYVHRGALGAEWLNEVFLVDLSGGVTAWVTDAGSASGAAALVDGIAASAPSRDESESGFDYGGTDASAEAGVAQEGPLTVRSWGDGAMAVFAVGRYVHGASGADTASVVSVALDLHAAARTGAVDTAVEAAPVEPDSPFPDAGVDGWRSPKRVDRFTSDNLYAKINGRADTYIQFNVVGLAFGTYYHEASGSRTVDVYWYDMGESVNAFGIYQAEAPPDAVPMQIGREGYQAGAAVFFWEGASYVQVLPVSADEGDNRVALEIAGRISAELDDVGGDMWALDVLPEEGRVPNSFAFLARDAFGLDFLAEVFTAHYEFEGTQITLFIHRAEDEASANALLVEYERFFQKYGQVVGEESDASPRIVAGTVAGVTDAVFAKGPYLGGVAGADDPVRAHQAASEFYASLTVPQ